MKRLLYIGNKLSSHGLNKTSIETLGTFFEQEGYQVYFTSSKKNQLLRLVDMCLEVIRKRNKVDYVLIDTYSTSSFWYALATSQLCRLFRLPYLPILRGGDLPNRLQKSPNLSRLLFDNAYKNVAPSNYLLKAFESFGIENLVFIPNNIEIKNYKYKERKDVAPRLLWVRAFATIYNPTMAVDVLQLLKQDYPNATLCMVGPDKDGSLQHCKDYARQKNCEVEFTGGLTKSQWTSLSEKYDVFINTTHFDNTPVSVMEVMALGIPVVSTNVGGIPYLLDHDSDALLVADSDAQGMAEAIKSLLDNPEKALEIAKQARQKVEHWDWEIVKRQWFELLK